jgi:thiamine pyrophosphate-dependent acetolactate synthase large subunit-like protein
MINAARRPVLYLGGGVVHAGAAGLAVELAEKAGLPTVMTLMALGHARRPPAVARHARHAAPATPTWCSTNATC